VEASDLRRSYHSRTGILKREKKIVEAVRGVSFGIEQGELFGLLGPNGAGKTTTIKMLITLLLPTGGSATVLGQDVVRAPREVRRHIGYVFGGDRGLYERLSALDTSASSPSCTAFRRASRGNGSATCWRWSA
jgi:ABC-2 type transport system ATP-binding protein